MAHYDVIVAGVGGMGSAALYHLARRGVRVVGFEQFAIAHDRGSSHGGSRIIRLAYAEHPDYVPLLRRAYELWRELEEVAGERLLVITGGIDAGTEASATVQGSLASCAIHALAHERLDATALARRFPGYRLPDRLVAVFQPDAGFLLPERCVMAHAAAARAAGAEIHQGERVLRWRAEGGGVVIETEARRYAARRLVITAGAWLRKLVPPLEDAAVPERQVVIWTRPLAPERFTPEVFPVFNMEAPEGRFYGFPDHAGCGFKIGKYHHRHERVDDPGSMNRNCDAEDEALLRAGIRRYFPDADGPTLAMQTCLFTNSPDEHFLIDALPHAPQVLVAGGFSGHGFKFCSVVGEIVAQLASDGATMLPIEMFRITRPAVQRVLRAA